MGGFGFLVRLVWGVGVGGGGGGFRWGVVEVWGVVGGGILDVGGVGVGWSRVWREPARYGGGGGGAAPMHREKQPVACRMAGGEEGGMGTRGQNVGMEKK